MDFDDIVNGKQPVTRPEREGIRLAFSHGAPAGGEDAEIAVEEVAHDSQHEVERVFSGPRAPGEAATLSEARERLADQARSEGQRGISSYPAPPTLTGSLLNAAAERDQKLKRDAAEQHRNIGQLGPVASLFAQLRIGGATRPDAGLLDRMRAGRQAVLMRRFESAAVALQTTAHEYVRAPANARAGMDGQISGALTEASRALRDVQSVVKSTSPTSVLELYQRGTLAMDRSVKAIDGVGNAQRSASFDQSMSRMKGVLSRAGEHVNTLLRLLGQAARP